MCSSARVAPDTTATLMGTLLNGSLVFWAVTTMSASSFTSPSPARALPWVSVTVTPSANSVAIPLLVLMAFFSLVLKLAGPPRERPKNHSIEPERLRSHHGKRFRRAQQWMAGQRHHRYPLPIAQHFGGDRMSGIDVEDHDQ